MSNESLLEWWSVRGERIRGHVSMRQRVWRNLLWRHKYETIRISYIILSNRFGNKLFDTSLHVFVISTVTVLTAFLCKSDNVILFSAGPLFCSFNTGTLCSFLSQALDDGDDWLFGTVGALGYFLCPLFVLTDRIHTKCDFAPSVWN